MEPRISRSAKTEERRNEMPVSNARLAVRALMVAYNSGKRPLVALRDLSLALAAGELVGLVGPNGCGKTTLIRAVTKVVKPISGEVWLCGDEVGSLAQAEIARRVDELSGGERQRVAVARALAQETPVLLLDEPTAHLDIGHQASVLGLMRALCRDEGKAVLAVVHDLTLGAAHCDRLVMLRPGGTVAAEGSAEEVLRPELLAEVYETAVDVFPHPRTGRPVVAPRMEGG